jgi:hypothetical protein
MATTQVVDSQNQQMDGSSQPRLKRKWVVATRCVSMAVQLVRTRWSKSHLLSDRHISLVSAHLSCAIVPSVY